MCLLIVKPPNVSIPDEHLIEGAAWNSHGSGISFVKEGKIYIRKSPTWGAGQIIKDVKRFHDCPMLIHFRLATHGSRNHENTHPFMLPGEEWVAAHNGVITGIKTKADESDTRAFLRQCIYNYQENIKKPDFRKALENVIGSYNKLAFLNRAGEHFILNEKSGHWKDGAWYSNSTYVKTPPAPKSKYFFDMSMNDLVCNICNQELTKSVGFHFSTITETFICKNCQ